MIPSARLRLLNSLPIQSDRAFVLYWMTAFRRTSYNFALQHAVDLANELKKPLVVLEALRCHYRWASDRFHRFVIDGMMDNARAVRDASTTYVSYVEPHSGHGSGLIEALSQHACVVVSDDFPCYFHPAMYSLVARHLHCRIELVDSNTIVPMRWADRTFTVAHSYRRYMQKIIYEAIPEFPLENPLKVLKAKQFADIPKVIQSRWGISVNEKAIDKLQKIRLSDLPLDHAVAVTSDRGGEIAARSLLKTFVSKKLSRYSLDRNEPEKIGSSNLSAYLHFGQIGPHEVFMEIAEASRWNATKLGKPNGKMDGFWNMGENAEAFLDQLMTWREIGFNMCCRERHYLRYESLPDWALTTLEEHASDERPYIYTLNEFEESKTHDPLWNAAQQQLVREGRIHNYLRMLWGKKILHWSRTPQDALQIMIELNNKYALDGRDPNSYSGIFWVLGRYDRAWGPERSIFGKVRYMTSESTQNKWATKNYIAKYSPA